jgi:hypothetical protein
MPNRKTDIGTLSTSEKVLKIFTKSIGEVKVKLIGNNPNTVREVMSALPFDSEAQTWGDEVYFRIPVKAPVEKAETTVDVGDVAYWPPGESMCIFFGPTPASKGSEPRAYSPVNIFGKVNGDPSVFKKVKNGEKIRVERE